MASNDVFEEYDSSIQSEVKTFPDSATSNYESLSLLNDAKQGISVRIKDQERQDEDFVVYIIEVNINNPTLVERAGGLSTWTVRRRFSEFDLLKGALEVTHPACIMPPLPDKLDSIVPWKYASQKYDSEFIENRRQRLESFLHRLLFHPQLGQDDLIFRFLQDSEDWKVGVKNRGVPEKLAGYMQRRSASLRIREPAPVVAQLRERAENLSQSITRVMGMRQKVNQHAYGVHKLHKNYGEALCEWCGHEDKMADALQTMGHLMDSFSGLLDTVEEDELEVAGQLQDYLKYSGSLLELCRRQEMATLVMEQEKDYLEGKRKEKTDLQDGRQSFSLKGLKAKLMGPPSDEEREQMMTRLSQEIVASENRLFALQGEVQRFTEAVNNEVARFEQEKRADILQTMQSYAGIQLQRSKRCLRLWTQCSQVLNKIPG